jgi:enamine deaminase RidA (YjgF/YER057c/UK114 family)
MTTKQPDVPQSATSHPDSRFPLPAGWPRGSGYAHAVVAEGRLLFIAGQIGWDPVSGRIVDGGLVEQTSQAFRNIVAVLAAAGADPSHLVRLTWFITDRDAYLRDRKAIGAAYRDVIGRHFPTMSVLVVAGLLEPGAVVEIEATAVIPHGAGTTNSTGASSPTL